MTDEEMLEAEKYWCENCCNWDKGQVQIDGCANCKLTGTIAYAQESGKECKFFNVPSENVIVPPCKVGDKVFFVNEVCDKKGDEYLDISVGEVVSFSIQSEGLWAYCRYFDGLTYWHIVEKDFGKTVFLTKEEAEQALKGSGKNESL